MDLLQYYEAIKVFVKEERDTYLGLLLFMLVGLGIAKYLIVETISQLQPYSPIVMVLAAVVVLVIWYNFRKLPIIPDKFTIGISQFDILMLDVKTDVSSETKRNLRRELVDYVYSALHFNREKLELDKYVDVVRLPPRFEITQKNAKKICKDLKVELLIWGSAYYKDGFLYFKPRFEFRWEPTNLYYKKFKKNLNSLRTFKINITENLEKEQSELSELMHYLSFLGLMFNGIHLTHQEKFQEAKECFELALRRMKKEAFSNESISHIYLATRFFSAHNLHKWGNYVLIEKHDDTKALELYEKGAKSFFVRAKEMEKLKNIDKEGKLEHSLLYGIYLLTKEGKYKEAEKKLDSIKRQFDKKTIHLYYLYKGLIQKNISKAEPFFDKALKGSRDDILLYEKIADYFYSKGKFKGSIKYFEKRLKLSPTQIYSPRLLEEDVHRKLSKAYLMESNLVAGLREKIIASINEKKNLEKED